MRFLLALALFAPLAARAELAVDTAVDSQPVTPGLHTGRTRYLYAPTAMTLKQGEGYVSQKELFFTSAAVGLTDNVTVLAGTAIPFLGTETLVIGGLKIGGELVPGLHLAGGLEGFSMPFLTAGVAGFGFGSLTAGSGATNVTLSAGVPFALAANTHVAGSAIVVLGGALAVSDGLALVTENWFLAGEGTVHALMSGGARLSAGRLSADVAFIFADGAGIPLPWLDVSYAFGS